MLSIIPLADRRDLVPIVAGWHYEEWGLGHPGGSPEMWTDTLRGQLGRDSIPIAWVALLDGRPVGSVKLIEQDMATRPELSPWLSSLYVVEEHRGEGIASKLIDVCEEAARALGHETIYLYTTTAEGIYVKAGWETVIREPYGDEQVAIMSKYVAT
jgi:GNAT superfamily N-acetyltransferase